MVLVNKDDRRIRVVIPDDKLKKYNFGVRCVEIYDTFTYDEWEVETVDNVHEKEDFDTKMKEIIADEAAKKAKEEKESRQVKAVDKETGKAIDGKFYKGYIDKKVNEVVTRRYRTGDLLLPDGTQFL